MKGIRPFSIFESEIDSRMIIEASAGTGKTYNITGLYIRLLLEKRVTLDQILVVTFTRMATKELKDRILEKLRDCLRALEKGETDGDPFLVELLEFCIDVEQPEQTIREAIRNFDEARVFTIHGFCQQVLGEESLIAGVPFEMEITRSDDFMVEAAEDYWRNFVYEYSDDEAGRYYITRALGYGSGPESLLSTLKSAILNREAEFESVPELNPVEAFRQLIEKRKELASIWELEKEEILSEIRNSDVSRITTHLESRVQKMEMFLNDNSFQDDSFDQLVYFTPSHFREKLKKNGKTLPEHRFFDLCEEFSEQTEIVPRVMTWFLKSATEKICELRDKKAFETNLLTYNDLLSRLKMALEVPDTGPLLANRLRKQYPYALVDEFQDTDPIQYQIFDKIYPKEGSDSTLYMIGDPKQAIYAFRGADLYAYLKAREDVNSSSSFTLLRNFRSTPKLVEAVNVVFTPVHKTPFLDEQIVYNEIEAARKDSEQDYLVSGQVPVPLKIFHQTADGTKEEVKYTILRETSRQVFELIRGGRNGVITLKDEEFRDNRHRNLNPGDIAILIHSHRDAEITRSYLKSFGIGSVTYSREKVFESREAERVEQLMAAIVNPASFSNIQVALTTGFFGNKLSQLYKFQNSETAFLGFTEVLQELNQLWHRGGCYLVMRKLLFEYHGLEYLSQLHDSERIVTNIQQLFEIASAAEAEYGFDPPALLRWFRKKMVEASDDDEETLRLESDENLVKIITIHNSKGLEFPVVFCPTLWSSIDYTNTRRVIESYHREVPPYKLVLNLEQFKGDRRTQAELRSRFEEVSEEVRKAYVALTRAKYECRVFWGHSSFGNLSGLGALLYGKDKVKECISGNIKVGGKNGLDEGELPGLLKRLADQHPDLILFNELEGFSYENIKLQPEYDHSDLSVRVYNGDKTLRPQRSLYSFSSLVNYDGYAASEPDHDQYVQGLVESYFPERSGTVPTDIFHFPRGTAAGTFIHKLFEHPKFDFRDSGQHLNVIKDLIDSYGIDEKWVSVLKQMLMDVSDADYKYLALNKVSREEMLKEMEFYFPVKEPDLGSVQSILHSSVRNIRKENSMEGYLNGFIDLVVRQNDRYFIIDYKSNHLGDTADHYSEDALREEMIHAGYDIQYHFYTVALKKYLKNRLPGFSYESHFGGVYYLFIRGMKSGSGSGIFYDRPDLDIIRNLEDLLDRNE